MSLSKALTAAAGNAGGAGSALYVEDVFSTYLYTGNGSTQTITNGISLAGRPSDGVYVHLNGESLANIAPTSISVSNTNVSLSTSQKKFGSSSLSFNASSPSYLYLSEPSINSSDAFCVETWAYFSGTTGTASAMQMIAAQYINSQPGRLLFGAQSDTVVVRVNGGTIYLSGAVSANTWHHIAWTYDGTTHRLFVDGDLKSTSTSMPAIYTGINTQIGGTDDSYLAGYDLTGFLDEFRITKGKARYTSNFSVPTAAFAIDTDDGSGAGGLVWIKNRDAADSHYLADTERNTNGTLGKRLESDTTDAQVTNTAMNADSSFNSDGFTVASYAPVNTNGEDYASWTFRKAEKFFDVVTYTGDGVAGREIAHNLGSVPACIVVKRTDSTSPWIVYHSSIGNNKILQLEATLAAQTFAHWYNTNPTSSVFTVNSFNAMNASGATYVAYVFASDAGGFGDDGSESIIKCGSYTGNGGTQEINLGFEPQWLLVKSSTQVDSWFLTDTMRGMPNNAPTPYLLANLSNAEADASAGFFPQATATGFKIGASGSVNASGQTFIYIAIRRPMKTPESGTEVFKSIARAGTGTSTTITGVGFAPDASIIQVRNAAWGSRFLDRLRNKMNDIYTTGAEQTITNAISSWNMDGVTVATDSATNGSGRTFVDHYFKRATGFFDVVAYTGDGTSSRDITHNLGAVPEFIVTKRRNLAGSWAVYHPDLGITSTSGIRLNTSDGSGYSQLARYPTTPTSTVYTIGNDSDVNTASSTYVSYLFATLAGVSKVGSYTGTGADLNVDCGFSAGARWVMIKRYGTSTTGDWYVWDSVRGIVAGNDPYLLLNSTAAEVTSTDYIDPLASGFTVTSTAPAALNASGGNYIFLAIA